MFVSRDSRRVLDTLLSVSGKEKPTIEDMWVAEVLTYSYFPKILIGHIKRFYNPKSKNEPDKMLFYVKPTKSQNHGRRRDDDWQGNEKFEIWKALSQYVITDYSYEDLELIKKADVTWADVEYGIAVGRSEKVYSIPYAIRVAEKHHAEKEMRRQETAKRRELFTHEDANSDITSRSRLEIAGHVAQWQEMMENLELQKKVKKLYEGE